MDNKANGGQSKTTTIKEICKPTGSGITNNITPVPSEGNQQMSGHAPSTRKGLGVGMDSGNSGIKNN